MKLKLIRDTFTDKSTLGNLYIDDEFFCYTLEDKTRDPGVKVPNATSIPYGVYEVDIDFSNRFQRMMPHVLDVPGFIGIRIHPGNTDKDTEGCILVGMTKAADFVGDSQLAFSSFFQKLSIAFDDGDDPTITITKE